MADDDDKRGRLIEENKVAETEMLDEVKKLRENTERARRLNLIKSELKVRRRDASGH